MHRAVRRRDFSPSARDMVVTVRPAMPALTKAWFQVRKTATNARFEPQGSRNRQILTHFRTSRQRLSLSQNRQQSVGATLDCARRRVAEQVRLVSLNQRGSQLWAIGPIGHCKTADINIRLRQACRLLGNHVEAVARANDMVGRRRVEQRSSGHHAQ